MTVAIVDFERHQGEITSMMRDMLHLEPQPVDIPVARYIELQKMGVLAPFLWMDGEIVKGVALIFISPSLRNPKITDAGTDVLWVKPEHRGNSHEFIEGIKRHLVLLGVDYWMVSSRDSHPIANFLERNDFKPLEKVYYLEV